MAENVEEPLNQLLRDFLESDPLYRSIRIAGGFVRGRGWPPRISHYCSIDRAEKTFHGVDWEEVESGRNYLAYKCGDCEEEEIYFLVRGFDRGDAGEAFVEKIGQFPAWSIEPSKAMKRFLGPEASSLYKKALVCLSQSYGLGALAYLRRVVEDSARDILLLIAEIRENEGVGEEEVKSLRQTSEGKDVEKILKTASELFPDYLKPGNENPMAAIYAAASIGIHREDENECTRKAKAIIKSLEYAIPVMSRQIQAQRDYLDAMGGLP